jgi:hypothetical protein
MNPIARGYPTSFSPAARHVLRPLPLHHVSPYLIHALIWEALIFAAYALAPVSGHALTSAARRAARMLDGRGHHAIANWAYPAVTCVPAAGLAAVAGFGFGYLTGYSGAWVTTVYALYLVLILKATYAGRSLARTALSPLTALAAPAWTFIAAHPFLDGLLAPFGVDRWLLSRVPEVALTRANARALRDKIARQPCGPDCTCVADELAALADEADTATGDAQ